MRTKCLLFFVKQENQNFQSLSAQRICTLICFISTLYKIVLLECLCIKISQCLVVDDIINIFSQQQQANFLKSSIGKCIGVVADGYLKRVGLLLKLIYVAI
eukprot:TRINITY_DN43100_c0_g1_i1.p4 TRINITY_DN43100_c0_g1~~TRINITY_DN43100_c0_g1_i1.p4  ORF type:complete len:101 (+),score=3.88 TRINITY_DN43100_c0_g1_i1:207-509(+)